MDGLDTILFNCSSIGASHIKDNKPCQDYSIAWQEGDICAIIVCDGHGSSTYVRSDVGSRLAAEAALDAIKRFVLGDPEWLLNTSGAVTARETDEALRFNAEPPGPDATETEQAQYSQRLLFIEQVNNISEQDTVFEALFTAIYEDWIGKIAADKEQDPFSEEELALLNGNRIEKAYGTTLMAYVQTPSYWLAFHIGDGRLLSLNDEHQWIEPVPWDCNCFQNVTTSLCNSNPVPQFRYAFDATGKFPVALFCCSDGIEDSYGDYSLAPERLHTFYSSLINAFFSQGYSETISKIAAFLPKLSERGSNDDMSLAGIINLPAAKKYVLHYRIPELERTIEQEAASLKQGFDQFEPTSNQTSNNVICETHEEPISEAFTELPPYPETDSNHNLQGTAKDYNREPFYKRWFKKR